jgi:hypothetical protein
MMYVDGKVRDFSVALTRNVMWPDVIRNSTALADHSYSECCSSHSDDFPSKAMPTAMNVVLHELPKPVVHHPWKEVHVVRQSPIHS